MLINGVEIKGIIFDLDGTLYCSRGMGWRIFFRNIGRARYLRESRKIRPQFMGIDFKSGNILLDELFKKISEALNTDPWNVEKWYIKKFYPGFIRLLKYKYRRRDGVKRLFESLQNSGIKLSILSDYSKTAERLSALKIGRRFFTVIGSCEAEGALKPAPRPFLNAVKSMGLLPHEVLVVGDRYDTDGMAAEACGMPFIKISDKKEGNENEYTWEEFVILINQGISEVSVYDS